jgi:hypothetical protein
MSLAAWPHALSHTLPSYIHFILLEQPLLVRNDEQQEHNDKQEHSAAAEPTLASLPKSEDVVAVSPTHWQSFWFAPRPDGVLKQVVLQKLQNFLRWTGFGFCYCLALLRLLFLAVVFQPRKDVRKKDGGPNDY